MNKKKYLNQIIKIAGLIIIIIAISSCNVYKSINIGDIDNVSFKGMVENKISLKLQVPVSNPNSFKIKIKSMDLDLTLNGNYLGKMKNAKEIIIPPKSDQVQDLDVDIYVKNALSSMATLYRLRKANNVEMQIDGTIKIKALLKTKSIKVSEKQIVSI